MLNLTSKQYTSTVIKEGGLKLWNPQKKQWRDVYCKLQQSGWLYWFEKASSNKPIHGVDIKVIAGYFVYGELIKILPNTPGAVAEQEFERMFAIPLEPNDRCDKNFFLCKNEAEMNSWMTSIFTLLEQPVPQQYKVSAPCAAYNTPSRPTSPCAEPPANIPVGYAIKQPVSGTVPVMLLRGIPVIQAATQVPNTMSPQESSHGKPFIQSTVAGPNPGNLSGPSQLAFYYPSAQTPPPFRTGQMMPGITPMAYVAYPQSLYTSSTPAVAAIYGIAPEQLMNLTEKPLPQCNNDQRPPEQPPRNYDKRQPRGHGTKESDHQMQADRQDNIDLREP